MQDHTDKSIRDYFQQGSTPLPSNFNWQIMQRVYALRIRQAKRRAIWESGLIMIVTLLAGVSLLAGYFAYAGTESWTIPSVLDPALPAILTLVLFVMFDAGLGYLKR